MKVRRIHIENVVGIDDLEIRPGHITVIEGRNEEGKTRILDAINAVFTGGHDESMLSRGKEEGRITLNMTDGTEFQKRFKAGTSTLKVKKPDGGAVSRAQSYINEIHDSMGLSPVELLRAKPKARGAMLLEAVPMTLTRLQIEEATKGVYTPAEEDAEGHALKAIDRVHKKIYDERTLINRDATTKAASIVELTKSLPEAVDDENTLKLEQSSDQAALDELRKSYQEKIAAIHSVRDQELFDAQLRMQTAQSEAHKKASKATEELKATSIPTSEQVKIRIAARTERISQASKNANTVRIIDDMRGKEEELKQQSQRLTDAIKRLDTMKTSLQENLLPLGITIGEDGDIYKDGLPFRRLNTATQMQLAFEIAALRSSKFADIGLVCVDGLELLDTEAFAAFEAWAQEHDELQFIVARVTDSDLTINGQQSLPVSAD